MSVKKLNDSEKIVEILQYFNLKKSEFSTKTGISTQQIFDLIRGQIANLSRENMAKIISAYPEISPYWLITGEGSMLAAENSGIMINQHDHNTATIAHSANLDKLIELSASQQRTIEKLVNIINN